MGFERLEKHCKRAIAIFKKLHDYESDDEDETTPQQKQRSGFKKSTMQPAREDYKLKRKGHALLSRMPANFDAGKFSSYDMEDSDEEMEIDLGDDDEVTEQV